MFFELIEFFFALVTDHIIQVASENDLSFRIVWVVGIDCRHQDSIVMLLTDEIDVGLLHVCVSECKLDWEKNQLNLALWLNVEFWANFMLDVFHLDRHHYNTDTFHSLRSYV